MIKYVLFSITLLMLVSGCNLREDMEQNSLTNEEQTLYSSQNYSRDEIPTDIFKIIENEKKSALKRPTNTEERRQMFYDELPPNFSQLPRSEQIKIRDRLMYSTMIEFREQTDINDVNKDVYEYDVPSREKTSTNDSPYTGNIFDYGIPYSGTEEE